MPINKKILNEFYQGLKLLIEFETGQSSGAMSLQFYAINKVAAHFNSALEKGNVIAPFFLHYLADKFPESVDKALLPDLSTVPCHKSKAQLWVKDYKTFLAIYEKSNTTTKPRIIECKDVKQSQQIQKNIYAQLHCIEKEVISLIQSSSLGGLLAAKILEHIQEQINNDHLTKNIIIAYERSAFHPNLYAMHEYAQFLHKKNMRASTLEDQRKLETELNLLVQSQGDIRILVDHYQKEKNYRFLSQWLFESVIDGGDELRFIIARYIFDDQMKWYDKISNEDQLAEGIKWLNWYETHGSASGLHAFWQKITALAYDYINVIGNDKYKASFLCYALDRLIQHLHKQSQTMSQKDYISQNEGLFNNQEYFKEIIGLTWLLNNGTLPSESSSIVINEMAIILEERQKFKDAEYFYRQAYAMDRNNVIHQYNLASILTLQNKDKMEQISLYFDAASQGCGDSIQCLFKLLVIDGEGSIEHLEKLYQVIESVDFDVALPLPIQLLVNLILMTIFQKRMNIEIIKWIATKRDGKDFFQVDFLIEAEGLDNGMQASERAEKPSSKNDQSSSIEVTDTKELTTAHYELKETVKKDKASTRANSFKLFQPAKNETNHIDTKKERALNKLHELNNKQVKNLSLNDFIQAKKAYQILMGESGIIEISHKGKTSGSRAKVGAKNMHLTHGRDRMSIGAQNDIKEAINELYGQINI